MQTDEEGAATKQITVFSLELWSVYRYIYIVIIYILMINNTVPPELSLLSLHTILDMFLVLSLV